ncbi:hypothetical protein VTJ49DRAFT_1968 [Mycothermus thermophilus]|uniref:Ubiquitin-like domain-containing protein n=1 Tax=Humicola insolens TaxID=85995 RepID=A0ABR3VNI7_HUMIN
MENEPGTQPAVAPARKRALPFKRTAPRLAESTQPNATEDDPLDLFRRSKDILPQVYDELEQEAREAEAARTSQENARKRKNSSATPDNEPPSTRRRSSTALDASQGDDDDDLIMDVKGKGKEIIPNRRPPFTPEKPIVTDATRVTRSISQHLSRTPAGSQAEPVAILDSDDDSGPEPKAATATPRSTRRTTTHPAGDSSSPIEIVESRPSNTPPKRASTKQVSDDPSLPSADDDFSEWVAKARALRAQQNQQKEAPIIKILVTSGIPAIPARHVLVTRRINQSLQPILETWPMVVRNQKLKGQIDCPDLEGLLDNPDFASSLFLTFKKRRVFGQCTLAALGVQVDAQGRLVTGSAEREGYILPGTSMSAIEGAVELEIWTEDSYAEYMRRQEARTRRALLMSDDDDDVQIVGEQDLSNGIGGTAAAPPPPPPTAATTKKPKGIRLILKSRDHEPLRMTAKPDTDVEMLIDAFRAQRGIGGEEEWEVSIWFDGEKLDEDALVADLDVDLEDVNQLEVVVKKVGG